MPDSERSNMYRHNPKAGLSVDIFFVESQAFDDIARVDLVFLCD